MSDYSVFEEKLNVYSHLAGAVLGFVGLVLLIIKSFDGYGPKGIVSFIIFGLSIVILFLASANYHRAIDLHIRLRRKVIDHCAIYILIAGTYTPFALAAIGGKLGWIIFGISWSFALIGIILKIFFTGRFNLLSTLMYLALGWMIIFFISPLMEAIAAGGISWLVAGGVCYTIGAIVYLIDKINLNHAIFHFFVLAGCMSHFFAIYFYI